MLKILVTLFSFLCCSAKAMKATDREFPLDSGKDYSYISPAITKIKHAVQRLRLCDGVIHEAWQLVVNQSDTRRPDVLMSFEERLNFLVMSLEEHSTEKAVVASAFFAARNEYKKYPDLKKAREEIFSRNFTQELYKLIPDLSKYPELNKKMNQRYLEIPLVAAPEQETTIKEYLLKTFSCHIPHFEALIDHMMIEQSESLVSLAKIARMGFSSAVFDTMGTQAQIHAQDFETYLNTCTNIFSKNLLAKLRMVSRDIRNVSSGFELDEHLQELLNNLNLISPANPANNQ